MWHYAGGLGWGLGLLGMVVFWIAIVVALVGVARLALDRGVRASSQPPESPLEILQRRYALGEIDRAEFEDKRRDLQPPAVPAHAASAVVVRSSPETSFRLQRK